MKLLEGRCFYYGDRNRVKALLSLCQVKALVTSHEREDWQLALSIASQVSQLTYLLILHILSTLIMGLVDVLGQVVAKLIVGVIIAKILSGILPQISSWEQQGMNV